MASKVCSLCGQKKSLDQFYIRAVSKDGRTSQCKDCERARKLEYYHSDKEQASIRAKEYKANNRDYLNEYQRNRIHADLNYRLSRNLRNRLNQMLRKNKTDKQGSAVRDLGCSLGYFREYIGGLFREGMSWENYGSDWHLDHIVPLCQFDLFDREQFLKSCHYTNIQPLWVVENQSKGGRLDGYSS